MSDAERPALELYGASTGNCLRVAVALEVLGIDFVAKPVDLSRMAHFDPVFLQLNPLGRVPVLVDRDASASLTQSNAILLHLCDLRPGVLLPPYGNPGRARVLERFFYFVTDVIAPDYSSFFLANHGASQGAGILSDLVVEAIVTAERFLADGAHVAGQDFSLADVAALTVISANRDRVDWRRAPKLLEWLQRLLDRDDVQRGLGAFSPDARR